MEEALLWYGELLSIAKLGTGARWRANAIRTAITAYCSIIWSYLECSLWVKNTSKFCQSYFKGKEEQHIFWLMSWLVQSATLNPIELVRDELDLKLRAKQHTTLAGNLGRTILSLPPVFDGICKAVIAAEGVILMNQKYKFFVFFFFFLFNLHLMWLRKTCT